MVNFGPLGAEIISLVWGTPANQRFLVLVSLLQPRRSTEANQTLLGVGLHSSFYNSSKASRGHMQKMAGPMLVCSSPT